MTIGMNVYDDWDEWEKMESENDIPDYLKTIVGYPEEWVTVKGYPNYEVSIYGEIYNKVTGRILTPQKNIWGYSFVHLYNENGPKMFTVHRLVAIHFIPNPENKPQVNHKCGYKANNRVTNLEWTTNSENELHAFRLGLKKPSGQKKVRIIETGEIFNSMNECARHINGNFKAISNCTRGKSKTHKGYHFEVVSDEK